MKFKRILFALLELDIFIEETYVFFCVVFEFVIKPVFDDLSFYLAGGHPRQKLFLKFSSLEDGVLELQSDLLNRFLSVCLQISQSRVHIISL